MLHASNIKVLPEADSTLSRIIYLKASTTLGRIIYLKIKLKLNC